MRVAGEDGPRHKGWAPRGQQRGLGGRAPPGDPGPQLPGARQRNLATRSEEPGWDEEAGLGAGPEQPLSRPPAAPTFLPRPRPGPAHSRGVWPPPPPLKRAHSRQQPRLLFLRVAVGRGEVCSDDSPPRPRGSGERQGWGAECASAGQGRCARLQVSCIYLIQLQDKGVGAVQASLKGQSGRPELVLFSNLDLSPPLVGTRDTFPSWTRDRQLCQLGRHWRPPSLARFDPS